jgi:hypothetical protein
MSILDNIPASWRGIPIEIYSYRIEVGPAVKVHTGAYWKFPVIEDLGKAPTRIRISGFIDPDFGIIERPLLEAMITAPGAGMLTIPSKGVIYAHAISCEFREDLSNIVDVDLEFVQVKSPLGLLGDLLSGSLPDSIGDAIAGAHTSLVNDLGGAVGKATDAVKGLF